MATLTQTVTHASHCSSNAMALRHLDLHSQSSLSSPPPSSTSLSDDGAFAFVRIHGDVCLVQTNASLSNSNLKSSSLLAPVDLALFRHEFGTMFRLTRRARLPARDIQVLAVLDDAGVLVDADSGVVFLAREMTNQLLQYTSPRRTQNAPLRTRRRY